MLKDFGINRPIMVFYRGGYGSHFFKKLEQDAYFVTWAKYLSAKSLNSISDSFHFISHAIRKDQYIAALETRVQFNLRKNGFFPMSGVRAKNFKKPRNVNTWRVQIEC